MEELKEVREIVIAWLKAAPRTHDEIADKVIETMSKSWAAAKQHDKKVLFDVLFERSSL